MLFFSTSSTNIATSCGSNLHPENFCSPATACSGGTDRWHSRSLVMVPYTQELVLKFKPGHSVLQAAGNFGQLLGSAGHLLDGGGDHLLVAGGELLCPLAGLPGALDDIVY